MNAKFDDVLDGNGIKIGQVYAGYNEPCEGITEWSEWMCNNEKFKLRCKECGCRVLYKIRTGRMAQFEAR